MLQFRPLCVSLLVALVPPLAPAGGAASAQSAPEPAPAWLRVETEHFTLFGNRHQEELVSTAIDLERFQDVLSQLFPSTRVAAARRTRIYLFRDDESFAPFRLAESVDADAGYLLPSQEISYAAFTGVWPSRLVFKQYIHELLHRHLPGLPLWLRHGIAEYYSTFEADAEEARIGLPLEESLRWLALDAIALLPMAELIALEDLPAGDDESSRAVFYAQSWAAFHSLMAGDAAHRRRITDYIRRVEAGEKPVTAFPAAFGTDLSDFDEVLEEYVRGESFLYLRVAVGSREELEASVTGLNEAETAYHLGDLLLRLGPSRHPEARQRLRQAVEIDPGHALAWSGLGQIAETAGDHSSSLAHLEKAAELAPDDFAIQLALGEAHLRALGGRRAAGEASQRTAARAGEAFRRATDLRPEAGEAWAGLGRVGVLAAEPDPQAVAALERAVELLPPGRADVVYSLLVARARVGNADGVRQAEAQLQAAGAGDDLLAEARHVRLQVTVQQARGLAKSERLDDAIALLAAVRAEADDPEIAAQAAELLELIAWAATHNRFAQDYGEAARLYRAGDLSAAATAVERALAEAQPGRQVEVLQELRESIALEASAATD